MFDDTFRRLRQWWTETIHVIATVTIVTEQQLVLQQTHAQHQQLTNAVKYNTLIITTNITVSSNKRLASAVCKHQQQLKDINITAQCNSE